MEKRRVKHRYNVALWAATEMVETARFLTRHGAKHTSLADQLAALRLAAVAVRLHPRVCLAEPYMDWALSNKDFTLNNEDTALRDLVDSVLHDVNLGFHPAAEKDGEQS